MLFIKKNIFLPLRQISPRKTSDRKNTQKRVPGPRKRVNTHRRGQGSSKVQQDNQWRTVFNSKLKLKVHITVTAIHRALLFSICLKKYHRQNSHFSSVICECFYSLSPCFCFGGSIIFPKKSQFPEKKKRLIIGKLRFFTLMYTGPPFYLRSSPVIFPL